MSTVRKWKHTLAILQLWKCYSIHLQTRSQCWYFLNNLMTTYLHSYAFVTPIHSIPCITRLIVQVKWWVHLSSMLPCFFFILTHILRSIFPKQTFSLYFVHLVKNAQNALFLRSPLWAFQKNFLPPLTTGFYVSKINGPDSRPLSGSETGGKEAEHSHLKSDIA